MYNDPVWVDESKTVILFEYHEPVSVQDIIESQNKAAVMLGAVEQSVQFIVDLRDMKSMPRDLVSNYPAMSRGAMFKQKNFDRVVMVMDNSFMEAIISIFSRLYVKLEFVRTIEQANQNVGVDQSAH